MKNFSYELNALRAFAVIIVMCYHAQVPFFSNGYMGVDIFFVLSGYLIANSLQKTQNNLYGAVQFLSSRSRRLIPVLFIVCITTLFMSWALMLPDDFQYVRQSVLQISKIQQNIYFENNTGYFDPRTNLNPLLHTWSLAVELQFYFIFIILHTILPKKIITPVIFILLIFSTIFLVLRPDDYFSLWSRMSQLTAGAMLARTRFFKIKNHNYKIVYILILVTIILSAPVNIDWPGPYTVVLTIFTCLFIASATQNLAFEVKRSFLNQIYENKVVTSIGLMSYSLYLWHQPILVFARTYALHQPNVFMILSSIILSIFLSSVTYKFIESPYFKTKSSPKGLFLILLLPLLSVFTGNNFQKYLEMFPREQSIRLTELEELERTRQNDILSGMCHYNTQGLHTRIDDFIQHWDENCRNNNTNLGSEIIIFGDSHAADLASGFRLNGMTVTSITGASCPLLEPTSRNGEHYCIPIFNKFLEAVGNSPNAQVIVANRYNNASEQTLEYFQELLEFYGDLPNQVLLFMPRRSFYQLERTYALYPSRLNKISWDARVTDLFYEFIDQTEIIPANITFVDTNDIITRVTGTFRPDLNGRVLFVDEDHFSSFGAQTITQYIILNNISKK